MFKKWGTKESRNEEERVYERQFTLEKKEKKQTEEKKSGKQKKKSSDSK